MDTFQLVQFGTLLKREIWEHKNLFIWAQVLLAGLILLFVLWALTWPENGQLEGPLRQIDPLLDGASIPALAQLIMWGAVPFVALLYVCCFTYLLMTLYQDRKDSSILFWQSMPVSNLKTVLSKIVTVAVVAPFIMLCVMLVLFLCLAVVLQGLSWGLGIEVGSIARIFIAAVYSLFLVFLSATMSSLWLFPTVGWLLLFSAYAKNVPLIWAWVVFFLITMAEEVIFNTQFLANWIQSRANINQYVIFELGELPQKLFNYDMLVGVCLGTLLITGAVYMRRFVD